MKNLKTWKIAYTIVDGEHEYGDYLLHEAGRLTKAEVAAVMAVFWCGDCGPEEEARFLRELTDDATPHSPPAAAASPASAGKRPADHRHHP